MTDRKLKLHIARGIVSRIDAQGWKGKTRDKMALELWLGATIAVDASGNKPLSDNMGMIAAMLVAMRGYHYLLEAAEFIEVAR